MKPLLCTTIVLSLLYSEIPECKGITKGRINNIQTADGNNVYMSDIFSPKEIPLDMILRMDAVENMDEFFEEFVYNEKDNVTDAKSRVGYGTIQRRSMITRLPQAKCIPEMRTVSLKPQSSSVFYRPSCIRIERCGGCCTSSLMSCQAIESEILNVDISFFDYDGSNRLRFRTHEPYPVERHTKCQCRCKIQPEDCNKSQKYNGDNCTCECDNPDVEEKCKQDNQNKIWNENICSCQCREELECSTGYQFDFKTCRCEIQEGRRKPVDKPWIT